MIPVTSWETQAIILTQKIHDPALNAFMRFSSGFLPWIPLLAWLLWKSSKHLKRIDFFWVFVMSCLLLAVSDSSTSYFFKNVFRRLRPCKVDDIRPYIEKMGQGCGGKWGFFSSHAANAAAIVHFLSPFAFKKKWSRFLAWFIVGIVAFSRVYLGVHFPMDVITGLVWGILLAQAWRFLAKNSLKAPVSF